MDYWDKKLKNKFFSDPQNFLFGYGSLINDESRNSLTNDIHEPIPARISKKFGYKRTWSYYSPTSYMTALGLEKACESEATTINGIIFPFDLNNLNNFNEREQDYNLVNIPNKFIQSMSWSNIPKNSKIWVYVQKKKDQKANIKFPICQSYIDVCLLGCLKYGKDYAAEFLGTTSNWSKYWINDRLIPRRPWIHVPKHKEIDTLLEFNIFSKDFFKFRRLPETYLSDQ